MSEIVARTSFFSTYSGSSTMIISATSLRMNNKFFFLHKSIVQLKPAGVQKCLSENLLPVRVFSIHGDKLEAHEKCRKPTICQRIRKEENKHSSQIPGQGPLPHTLFSNEDHILVGVEGSQEVDEVLLVVPREDDLLIIAVESLV